MSSEPYNCQLILGKHECKLYKDGYAIMSDKEVISYLENEAPAIGWSIEGESIIGKIIVNGIEMLDSTALTYNRDVLSDIAVGFMEDYKRKTNAKT